MAILRTLVLWLLLVTSAAAQIRYEVGTLFEGVQPTSFGATGVFVPGDVTTPKMAVLLTAELEGKSWLWQVIGPGSTFQRVVTQEPAKIACFEVSGEGRYLVMLTVWDGENFRQAQEYVEIGEVPQPEPDPDPGPSPNPTPEPVEDLWGLIIEESSERTAAQAAVITSVRVRSQLKPGRWNVADKDVKNSRGTQMPNLVPWIERAKRRGLPTLFLHDGKGRALYEGDIPATVDDTIELLKKYQKSPAVSPATQRTLQMTRRGWRDPRTGLFYYLSN